MAESGACGLCGCAAGLCCARCGAQFYCGRPHQQEHWPVHRRTCCARYRLRHNGQLGRHLVASAKIAKGEVIFRETALVVSPGHSSPKEPEIVYSCFNCCRLSNFTKADYREPFAAACGQCRALLCSPGCLQELGARGLHSEAECALLRRLASSPLWLQLALFTGGSSAARAELGFFEYIGVIRCLSLTGSKLKVLRNLQSNSMLHALTSAPGAGLWEVLGFKMEDVDFAAGAANTNQYAFEPEDMDVKCSVIVEKGSFFAHSCVPNTRMVPIMKDKTDFSVAFVANVDIAAGSPITVGYTLPLHPTHMRMKTLAEDKQFRCCCPRCEDPTELGTFYTSICCERCHSENHIERANT